MLFKNLKAQASQTVLTSLFLCLFASASYAETPVFTPVSAWQVNTTELSSVRGLNNLKLPCVLSNEFDNGFVVRLSGGGGSLLAMAIDFRQDVFQKGKKYNAMISVGDSYVKQTSASAFNANTLIFNLRPLDGFYGTVKSGQSIEIGLDENVMRFDVGNLAPALAELEGCYTGTKSAPMIDPAETRSASIDSNKMPMPITPVDSEKLAPSAIPAPVASAPLPRSFDDIIKGDSAGITAMPSQQMKVSPARPSPVTPRAATISRAIDTAPVAAKTAFATWDAKAGEDMRAVLSRWANNAGYDLQWQTDQNGKVAQDVTLNGSFEDAVGQLLAENSAATGIAGHVETESGKKDIAPRVSSNNTAQWTALAGANIQSILDQWASKAGVAIVWQSFINVPVKSNVTMNGSFEQAVQSLLDQYTHDQNRPVAQLNIDPATGQRTLLMDMDKSV